MSVNRRGTRVPLEEGIFRDAIGLSAVVKVGTRQREKRFKAGTDRRLLREWRRTARAELELGVATAPAPLPPITLSDDIDARLALLPADSSTRRDTAILLEHWRRAFGSLAREALTAAMISQQLQAWHAAGTAAQTVNHRRRALAMLYQVLDGTKRHVVVDVPKLSVPKRDARGQPWPLIRRVLVQLPDRGRPAKGDARPTTSLTKLRLWVMARTGWPHAVIARLEESDLHLDDAKPWVYVRVRRKGKGVAGRPLRVTPAAVRALRRFAAADAFGPFSTAAMRTSFRVALRHARARWEASEARVAALQQRKRRRWPLPDDLHPYDVRHSWISWAYAKGGDLRAVQEVAIHASMTTTAHYAAAAVSARVDAMIDTLSAGQAGTDAGTQAKAARSARKR